MWLKPLFILCFLFAISLAHGQTLVTTFVDPCTKEISYFNIPIQGTTVIFFYGRQRSFTSADVSNGTFSNWINQVYSDYRKISPCNIQSTGIIRNQINSQVIGNVVGGVVSTLGSSVSKSLNFSPQNNSATAQQNNPSTQSGEKQTNASSGQNQNQNASQEQASTEMNIESKNEKSSESGDKSKRSSRTSSKTNPLIVSSDLTSAQNLDKSFTGIINLGISQSSMSGTSSWGLTSMIWFNLKQYAISGRYTTMHQNKKGSLRYIQNFNFTTVYSYGSLLGFIGYSGILNMEKSGVAGFNISGTATKTPDDKNLFISPSLTGFYTKSFVVNKKLTISPEIYVISTPLIYTSIDKITVTDRTFSGFLGTGFDYQLTKRFRFNANYKANLSTNPEFPILSFFLIGSKINL